MTWIRNLVGWLFLIAGVFLASAAQLFVNAAAWLMDQDEIIQWGDPNDHNGD